MLLLLFQGTWQDEMTDPKLRPQEFLFLLSDLSAKLQHVLVGGGAAPRNPFGTGGNTSLKSAGFHKVNQLGAEEVRRHHKLNTMAGGE